MSLLADHQILNLVKIKELTSQKKYAEQHISSGVSSYGFDARLGNKIQIFTKGKDVIIDPLNPNFKFVEQWAYKDKDQKFILPPHSFALGYTEEYFSIPRDITAICMGKSTYARCGLFVNVTPLESEWEGQVTLELYNSTPNPVLLYPEQGICQFLFIKGNEPCSLSYADKKGKYQFQEGITHPRSGLK